MEGSLLRKQRGVLLVFPLQASKLRWVGHPGAAEEVLSQFAVLAALPGTAHLQFPRRTGGYRYFTSLITFPTYATCFSQLCE